MNRTTQHISPNPALDFANAVLEETDGAREIIYMLHDIAQGVRENATTNDRMKASGILMDRGLGKCPKQPPVTNPAPASEPDAKEPKADNTPDSPRLVTQLDRSFTIPSDLHQVRSPKGIRLHPQNLSTPIPSSSTFSKSPTAVGHS